MVATRYRVSCNCWRRRWRRGLCGLSFTNVYHPFTNAIAKPRVWSTICTCGRNMTTARYKISCNCWRSRWCGLSFTNICLELTIAITKTRVWSTICTCGRSMTTTRYRFCCRFFEVSKAFSNKGRSIGWIRTFDGYICGFGSRLWDHRIRRRWGQKNWF